MIFAQAEPGNAIAVVIGLFFLAVAMGIGSLVAAAALQAACLILNKIDSVPRRENAEPTPPLGTAWGVVALTIVGVSLLGIVINMPTWRRSFFRNPGIFPSALSSVASAFRVMLVLSPWLFAMTVQSRTRGGHPLRDRFLPVLSRTLSALCFVFAPVRLHELQPALCWLLRLSRGFAMASWLAAGGTPRSQGRRPLDARSEFSPSASNGSSCWLSGGSCCFSLSPSAWRSSYRWRTPVQAASSATGGITGSPQPKARPALPLAALRRCRRSWFWSLGRCLRGGHDGRPDRFFALGCSVAGFSAV